MKDLTEQIKKSMLTTDHFNYNIFIICGFFFAVILFCMFLSCCYWNGAFQGR